ncbi:MAG TPA: hypothetical protein ENJ01_06865 [Gammaproteobacteria bacterium]|nr:hypothetical protein [Gammaproteobacteria bacterium]
MSERLKKLSRLAALMLLSGTAPGIASATAPGEALLPEEAFYGDLPVLLTASRLPQSREDAPVAVTLIDREMIEASGFTEIAELLRLVPGMIVGFDRAHSPIVGYLVLEEFLSRRMQVLVDGRSVYTPTLGGPVWSMLPVNIDDVERIEVIRGPNAASYGSNSFLGVINIITREPGLETGWDGRISLGTDSMREYSLRTGGSEGAVEYRFSAWTQENSGFPDRLDGKDIYFLNGRLDYRPNGNDLLTLDMGYSDGQYEQDEPLDAATPEHMRKLQSSYQLLKWQRVINDNQEIYLQAYHNVDDHIEEMVLNIGAPFNIQVPYDQNYRAERFDVEFQHTLTPMSRFNLAWGGSLRRDEVTATRYVLNSPIRIETQRAFVNFSWDLQEQGLINGGLMYEDNDIVTNDELSALLSWNYHLQPDTTLRLMITTATRTPVALEQYPDWKLLLPGFGTEQFIYKRVDVQSEKLFAAGIGLVGQALGSRLSYDLSFTRYDLRGLLGVEPDPTFPDLVPGSSYIANLGDATLHSLEVSLSYRFENRARLILNYSNAELDEGNDAVRREFGNSTPENLLSLLAIYPLGEKFTVSAGYYLIDDARQLGRDGIIDQINKLDVRMAYRFRLDSYRAELIFTGQNLGADYDGLSYGNRIDERLFVTLKLHI